MRNRVGEVADPTEYVDLRRDLGGVDPHDDEHDDDDGGPRYKVGDKKS